MALNALHFVVADRMLHVGDYLDFDDYTWRLRGSSLDPENLPAVAAQYTDEPIDAQQVKLIVGGLVRRDRHCADAVRKTALRKVAA